ncbi:MAG: response regulator [Acidimicrobiales bacterium]|nr:MAG: response regulator [Acidimicrobiales bacterium]
MHTLTPLPKLNSSPRSFGRPLSLLVVDDDEVDREMMVRGLTKSGIDHHIRTARDGVEAMEILHGQNGNPRLHAPFLVVLDLNMPRMDGHEFLETLRLTPMLAETPVFIVTTSDHEDDIRAAYGQGVAGYIVKDRAGSNYSRLIEMLQAYWRIVEFPS